jgi:hypothetical protein
MGFKKAKRERIWIKVLLGGPSGSGKTYSALKLASGISKKCGSRIAAIDTEAGRIRYYADEFDFDDEQLGAPFTPEKYIEAIEEAIDAGYKIIVIDSITHEWKGKGGCIEIHDKIPGNSYTAWGKVKPRHQAFVDELIQSPIHIIATARGKDEYILEEKNGKQVPKKVGVGMEQQDDAEYNYTVTFNIDQQNHVAEAMKDNTHLFEGRYDKLTEKDGEALYEWANSGDTPAPKPKSEPKKIDDKPKEFKSLTLDDKKTALLDLAKAKSKVNRTAVADVLKTAKVKGNNPMNIDSDELANTVYENLNKIN